MNGVNAVITAGFGSAGGVTPTSARYLPTRGFLPALPGVIGKLSRQQFSELLNILGTYVTGDLGDTTIYTTRRGRKVFFPRTEPNTPPSFRQLVQRTRFKTAQQNWMTLPPATRADWEQLMLRNAMDMTGQNAWISLSLNPDDESLTKLNKRARLSVSPPPPV